MHRIRALLATAIAAASLVLVAPPAHAASCNGASHQVSLTNGAASPGVGSTVTPVTFSVRYASNAGCAPSSITVGINGVGALSLATGGSPSAADLKNGVVYQATRTLPAGTRTYWFNASGGTGGGARSVTLSSVTPAQVVTTAPAPPPPTPPPATPKPTPKPTPQPTPRPTTAPSAAPPAPTPAAPPGGGAPAPAPAPPSGPAAPAAPAQPVNPVATPSPAPSDEPSSEASPTAAPTRSPGPSSAARPVERATPEPTPVAAPAWRDPPVAAGIRPIISRSSSLEVSPAMIAWLIATFGGLGLLVLLAPRAERSEVEPLVAGAAAAFAGHPAGHPAGSGSRASSAVASSAHAAGSAPPEREVGTRTDEARMPRWLRPSVQEGRRGIVRDRPPDDDTLGGF